MFKCLCVFMWVYGCGCSSVHCVCDICIFVSFLSSLYNNMYICCIYVFFISVKQCFIPCLFRLPEIFNIRYRFVFPILIWVIKSEHLSMPRSFLMIWVNVSKFNPQETHYSLCITLKSEFKKLLWILTSTLKIVTLWKLYVGYLLK